MSKVRLALPGVIIEVRMDSAFFSDTIVNELDSHDVEYTISVPFERFTELKGKINKRCRESRASNIIRSLCLCLL
ncbi:MAG: hypothetical protein GXP14_02170 [Gammaproteobacteria bacterium]|nr:hypothetical protein [Gammaproteobacteria bacterium]